MLCSGHLRKNMFPFEKYSKFFLWYMPHSKISVASYCQNSQFYKHVCMYFQKNAIFQKIGQNSTKNKASLLSWTFKVWEKKVPLDSEFVAYFSWYGHFLVLKKMPMSVKSLSISFPGHKYHFYCKNEIFPMETDIFPP